MPEAAPSTLTELAASLSARRDKPAILAFGADQPDVVTYAELETRIRRAATALRARGVGPEQFVLLWAANTPDWVTAYFGSIGAGAAVIPLDNQSSAGHAAKVIAHAQPKLVLTTRAHYEELEREDATQHVDCLLFDASGSEAEAWQTCMDSQAGDIDTVRPDQLASLLYTSGTTGTPKGVPLTHANLASNLAALLDAELVTDRDRVLMPLPLHHTYPFTVGLLTGLGAGASLIFPAGVSGPEISRAAAEGRATALLAVPRLCTALWAGIDAQVRSRGRVPETLFRWLLSLSMAVHRWTGARIGRVLFRALHTRLGGRLELIGCGGAKLDPALERRLEGLGWRVLTGYGLTETSPVLTFNGPHAARPGSQGRPLAGVEIRIADAPDGGHGEILARGPSVFAGYWNDEEKTQEAFTDDGWFRTGDLGWVDEDGYLHIAGRSKEVIVLPDGKNIFPEELEKLYGESPLFREIAILEHNDGLVALVVPDDDAIRARGALREAAMLREQIEELSARLAPYQRIGGYRVTREPLPRTQLGKLKRHLLAELYRNAGADARAGADTGADVQQALSTESEKRIWQWLEKRFPEHRLSLDTSPQLDLQIDSLTWLTLTLELERELDVSLTSEALSRVVTLRDLLQEIGQAGPAAGATPAASAIRPRGPWLRAAGSVLLTLNRLLIRTFFRLRVVGLDRLPADRPLVIVPNHASYLDPLAVAAALPARRLRTTHWAGWVHKMYAGPVMTLISRATQVFPVDPDRNFNDAIRTARGLLDSGQSLVWFPEGRRSPTGELEPFLPGIGVLLEGSDTLVVPTAVIGSFEAWPREHRLPRPARVTIAFGKPVSPAELRTAGEGDSDAERIRHALHAEVARLLQQR